MKELKLKRASSQGLEVAENTSLCPTKILRELSYFKNYDRFSFRLSRPLLKWIKSQGGSRYIRNLVLKDLEAKAQGESE
ncbi:hypothetical protein DRO54_03465 [Candidatus Bathyarchaeota archaeon]|nr:MAG: hypothetical protein DRO54_03465 [Candidatus Bathyarchaeota archaeon]